jgi:hypothetical protein
MAEHLYKTFRRLLSQLRKGAWYPEAMIFKDSATECIGTSIYDKQAYPMKEEADLQG